jgi:DNA-binding MarR family transcriptional regulator
MQAFPFGGLDESVAERVQPLLSAELWSSMRAFFSLASSAAHLLDYLQAVADRHDLPPAQVRLLLALGYQSPVTGTAPAALADILKTSRSNITGHLDALERQKFIERVHDMEDRRSVRIRLTRKGRTLADALVPELAEAAQRFLAALGPRAFNPETVAQQIEAALALTQVTAEVNA